MKNKTSILFIIALTILCFGPIFAYAYKFGFGVWDDHSTWAEMGGAIGGIYTPILALLTLIVLVYQSQLQRLSSELQRQSSDRAYVQDNKSDFDFLVTQFEKQLEVPINDSLTVRDILYDATDNYSVQDLLDDDIQSRLRLIAVYDTKIFSIWSSLYPILIGLDNGESITHRIGFQSCYQKATCILSLKSCKALDKMYFSLSSDSCNINLLFWKPSD